MFAVAIIALGCWRGVTALIGLGASIAVILQFILPSMLDGNNPQLVAVVGASAVAFLALYISNGLRPMTTVALLGTLAALALTVGFATVFTDLAHITGQQSEDALLVRLGTGTVDLASLLAALVELQVLAEEPLRGRSTAAGLVRSRRAPSWPRAVPRSPDTSW